ncbi:unnamed protein product [Brassica rapa subsp. narinosa]
MNNPPTDAAPPSLKRNSNDVGWEFGVLCDPRNSDKVKCKLCGKQFSGGVFRMKEHIAHVKGNVSPCPVSSKADQEKCKQAILDAKEKKNLKRKHDQALRAEVNIYKDINTEELEKELGTLKSPHFQGPIDQYATSINPEASLAAQTRQQSIHDAISKEKTHAVRQYCSRWIYEANIAFNAIDNDSFRMFCEALGQFGPGWVPPSQYQLREPLLNEEQQRTKEKLKSLEEEWDKEGCSVMTDAWTDMKRRSIMNLCVNSRGGTCFLSSKDTSKDSHTGEYIFKYIDQWIEDIGAEKIVQVVTDNATNNVAAAKMLKQKRPRIFWTGCAAHTLDLMLEAISKLPGIAKIIDQAKAVTIFVYAHHTTLSMMRTYTKKRDIVRPGATRFATCFLTLQSLYEKKAQLMSMFGSDEWHDCKHSKCIMDGFIACAETFYHGDFEKQDKVVNHEINFYKNKSGSFGRPLALKGCEIKNDKFDPEQNADVIFDDGNEDTVEEWLVGRVEEMDSDLNLLLVTQAPRVRDLYDDDFESEDDEEYVVDMEFEPDIYQHVPLFHDSQSN